MAFMDNTLYEMDSASTLASMQGKPKKAFMYFNRRIADLATPLQWLIKQLKYLNT